MKSLANWKLTSALMVLTLIVFVLCYFCTNLIGGSAYNSLFFVCSGIFGSLLDKSREQRIVGVLLIVLVVAYIGILCLENDGNVMNILIGVGYGLIGGICGFIYAKCSHIFAVQTGLSTLQILAVRFNLMLICLMFFIRPELVQWLSIKSILYMLFLSLVSNVLPVYFFQRGIIASGPEKNAIAIAFVPVLTMVIGVMIDSEFLSKTDIYFSILLSVFLMIPTALKLRAKLGKSHENSGQTM